MDPFGDPPRPKAGDEGLPHTLDRLSIDGLEYCIGELETEIARVRQEIASKQAINSAAEQVFQELIPTRSPCKLVTRSRDGRGRRRDFRRGSPSAQDSRAASLTGDCHRLRRKT